MRTRCSCVSNLRRLAIPNSTTNCRSLSQIMQSLPQPGDRLPGGAVSRHRQGPRRRPLRTRRGRRRGLLPRTGAGALRGAPGRLAGAQPPDPLDHGAEAGHQRSRQVIHEFARQVGDQAHLDYLYVLTVADVRGTNPKLWNTWKARLFEEFYERTKRALRRGLETPVDQEELIRETQAARARAACRRSPRRTIDRGCGRSGPTRISCAIRRRRSPGTPRVLAGRDPDDDAPFVAIRQLARPRRHGGAHLHAAPPAQLRAHHRGARPDGAERRRRAAHHQRQRLQPRDLRRARGQRRRRSRTRSGSARSSADCGATCSNPRTRRSPSPRRARAPGAHVLDTDPGRLQRRCPQRPHDRWNSSPATGRGCCPRWARCSRPSASPSTARRS